jgi:hypothetical protein
MSETILTEEEKKAKSKAAHRASMIVTGAFTALCGAAGGWIYWSGRGELPSFMYGPQTQRHSQATRKARPGLVRWQPLKTSGPGEKLILLDLRSTWSRAAALMEETTYGDPETAAWIEANFKPVRVDGDERPDLALRYLSGGWPSTLLLLPTGEILDAATYLGPKELRNWAGTLQSAWRSKEDTVRQAKRRADEARAAAWEERGSMAEPVAPARREFWKEAPYFPRWQAGPPAGVGKLEDPVWGGFFRYAAGPDWTRPETEKRLIDQAEAILYDADPQRRKRTIAYVKRFLARPQGGWYNAQAPEVVRADGHVVEGSYYYGLPEDKRLALGLPAVDKRIFTAGNALMARALKDAKALELLKPTGFLGDDVALAHAWAELGRKDKARSILAKAERELEVSGTPALLDRRPREELPKGLDQLLVPQVNAELLEVYQKWPELDSAGRAPRLLRWLAKRSAQVDPALWSRLTSR